jgi:hypothetical protein
MRRRRQAFRLERAAELAERLGKRDAADAEPPTDSGHRLRPTFVCDDAGSRRSSSRPAPRAYTEGTGLEPEPLAKAVIPPSCGLTFRSPILARQIAEAHNSLGPTRLGK